jgi:hypothetical protein
MCGTKTFPFLSQKVYANHKRVVPKPFLFYPKKFTQTTNVWYQNLFPIKKVMCVDGEAKIDIAYLLKNLSFKILFFFGY